MNQTTLNFGKADCENRELIFVNGMKVKPALPSKIIPKNRKFIGRNEELNLCMVAWGIREDLAQITRTEIFNPPSFRLEGTAGAGKTEMVFELSRRFKKPMPLYILHGHAGLTAEDLSLSIIPATKSKAESGAKLRIQAGPLATAMIKGGIFFFDEINRATERVLAQLAPVLDERRALYSSITGTWIDINDHNACPFLFCCAIDPSIDKQLPDYLIERTSPAIKVGYLPISDVRDPKASIRPVSKTFIEEFKNNIHSMEQSEKTRNELAIYLNAFRLKSIATENIRLAERVEEHIATNDIEAARRQIKELIPTPKNKQLFELYVKLKVSLLKEMSIRLWVSGDLALAEQMIDEALQLNPKDPLLYNTKGNLLMLMARYDDAKIQCNEALGIDPKCGVALATLGETYEHIGDLSAALESFLKASECDLNSRVTQDGKNYIPFEEYLQKQIKRLKKRSEENKFNP